MVEQKILGNDPLIKFDEIHLSNYYIRNSARIYTKYELSKCAISRSSIYYIEPVTERYANEIAYLKNHNAYTDMLVFRISFMSNTTLVYNENWKTLDDIIKYIETYENSSME